MSRLEPPADCPYPIACKVSAVCSGFCAKPPLLPEEGDDEPEQVWDGIPCGDPEYGL